MNSEINLIWQELSGDLSNTALVWQALIIVVALTFAWSMNGLMKSYVMSHAPESWKIGIGGIKRTLFPLTSLVVIATAQFVLHHWQHVGLLRLSSKLLLAMAAVRLAVYALRYVFVYGGWLRTLENIISTAIWIGLAFHLTGILPEIIQTLDDVSFNFGHHRMSLLLIIQSIITIFITLVTAMWLSRLIENRLMVTQQINMNVKVLMTKLVRILFLTIAILVALSALGLDITLLSVFGGALGVGLGFGLQKIASNYVSGFIILLDKSMNIGDVITVDNHYGIVSELRSRYMVLRKLDGTQVIIPHETLISNAVVNHSFTDRKSRLQIPIQISYESDLEKAMQLMIDVTGQYTRILQDPKSSAFIKGFAESGIDLNLTVWILDQEEGTSQLQSDLYLAIWHAFQRHSITIPYPQREVRLLGSTSLNNAKESNSQTGTGTPV